jgi:hypothetical protein
VTFNSPCFPFTVTFDPETDTDTPAGITTGFLPIRDMSTYLDFRTR